MVWNITGEQAGCRIAVIHLKDCANVIVRNTILSGHKTYRTLSATGKPVPMGSYDIYVERALNVSLVNCSQFNDIKDDKYWGIMASNYCKHLRYEQCNLSRFDAHQGVYGAVIQNSTLGYAGINAIGRGTLLVENTTVYGQSFINLRPDYGSTWQGDFVIRNCNYVPACGRQVSACLISGSNDGQHDFGYTCYCQNASLSTSFISTTPTTTGYPGQLSSRTIAFR